MSIGKCDCFRSYSPNTLLIRCGTVLSLMRILIIDNHTSHRDELAELLSDHEVSFIDVAEMDYRNVDADAIVLTGSHEAPFYSDRYNTELEFLRETELPVI